MGGIDDAELRGEGVFDGEVLEEVAEDALDEEDDEERAADSSRRNAGPGGRGFESGEEAEGKAGLEKNRRKRMRAEKYRRRRGNTGGFPG